MNTSNNRHKQTLRRSLQAGLVMLGFFLFSQGAFASSATHKIQNTVNLSYENSVGATLTDSDTVDVTVRLVSAAPTVTVAPAGPLGPVGYNETLSFTYTVTSNANGLDDYTLATNLNSATSASESSITPNPLALGGATFSSTSSGALAATDETDGTAAGYALVVAADDSGAGAGGEVHGFSQGNTIVFTPSGGSEYVCVVNHTVEPTSGNETNASATIYVDACTTIGTGSLTAGDLVSERADIVVEIDSGTDDEIVLLDVAVTPAGEAVAGGGSVAGNANQVSIEVLGANLDVYKFVRNVTTAANNTAAAALCTNDSTFQCLELDSGATYYKTAVQADPGDTLEYAILLYNNASQVQNIVVTDDIVGFTTYDNTGDDATLVYNAEAVASGGFDACTVATTGSGTCVVQDIGGGAPDSAAGTESDADSDWFEFATGTVTASGGDDGAATPAPVAGVTGGQLDAAVTSGAVRPASVVIFKVVVDS